MLFVYGDASRELTNPEESGWGGWCVIDETFYYIEGRWTALEVESFSITVLEHIVLEMLTATMLDVASTLQGRDGAPRDRITHVHEFSDNTGAEHSSERGKPGQAQMQAIVQRRYVELRGRDVFTHTDRVTSSDNDVADALSRGGRMMARGLAMMRSLGLKLQRVVVEPRRRDTSWLQAEPAQPPKRQRRA